MELSHLAFQYQIKANSLWSGKYSAQVHPDSIPQWVSPKQLMFQYFWV